MARHSEVNRFPAARGSNRNPKRMSVSGSLCTNGGSRRNIKMLYHQLGCLCGKKAVS